MKHSIKTQFLLWLIFFIPIHKGNGQQRPQYTQYIYNNFLLNPALAGIESYGDIKLGFRNQWVGFEGAPKTLFVSANWAQGEEYTKSGAMAYASHQNFTTQREYIDRYQASVNHHGLGFILVGDKIGPFKNIYANVVYAYHIKLQDQLNLSVGASAGIVNIGFDRNALNFEDNNDPSANNYVPNQIKPDINVGVWLYGSRFFAGASMQNAVPSNVKFTSDAEYKAAGKFVPHMFLTGGYKLFLGNDIAVTPSAMVKYVSPAPISMDINVKAAYQDKVWIGGGYRHNDAVSAMFGVNISSALNFTYAYDFTTSAIRPHTRGSHEIMIGILLNNVNKVRCPQRMW